jgi:hypothetical protein
MELILLLGELQVLESAMQGVSVEWDGVSDAYVDACERLMGRISEAQAGIIPLSGAAELMKVSYKTAYKNMDKESVPIRRPKAVPIESVLRRKLMVWTMALDGEVSVPAGSMARVLVVDPTDVSSLMKAMIGYAHINLPGMAQDPHYLFRARLARYLVVLHEFLRAGTSVPVRQVAEYYGTRLSGRPWELGYDGVFAQKKAEVLQVYHPAGCKWSKYYSRSLAPAATVLRLGRNTWTVRQTDPEAMPPSLNQFLPGAEQQATSALMESVRLIEA